MFTLVCVTNKNILEVLFHFFITIIYVSFGLLAIGVEFIAVLFPLVYLGGILVLFLFSLMLLNFREFSKES